MFIKTILITLSLFLILQNFSEASPISKEDWTIIKVKNLGGYVARFEIKYKLNEQYFSEASGTFAVGQSRSFLVSPEAVSIAIKCENNIFINTWSTVFSFNMARAQTVCFEISGTTLSPRWRQVDC